MKKLLAIAALAALSATLSGCWWGPPPGWGGGGPGHGGVKRPAGLWRVARHQAEQLSGLAPALHGHVHVVVPARSLRAGAAGAAGEASPYDRDAHRPVPP